MKMLLLSCLLILSSCNCGPAKNRFIVTKIDNNYLGRCIVTAVGAGYYKVNSVEVRFWADCNSVHVGDTLYLKPR